MPNNSYKKLVSIPEPVNETTPLNQLSSSDNEGSEDEYGGEEYFSTLKGDSVRRESFMADQLSMRLLAVADDDSEAEDAILNETLNMMDINGVGVGVGLRSSQGVMDISTRSQSSQSVNMMMGKSYRGDPRAAKQVACSRLFGMIGLVVMGLALLITAFLVGVQFIGPPNQPVGPYQLVERQVRARVRSCLTCFLGQKLDGWMFSFSLFFSTVHRNIMTVEMEQKTKIQEGDNFFDFYNFYEGPDSVGSNGYITYVSEGRAKEIGIANITMEKDELDVYYPSATSTSSGESSSSGRRTLKTDTKEEPFLYISSAPTEKGPRESIRLEGKRRFNRGLFIIDVRHMPAGCGVWPAFWLTDEANWPVNGEIDIVEGVNYQSEAKTALHTTKGCDMYDVPVGTMTGIWDSAVGIPDKKTGVPDMTIREARNCFVYDPHQWLNQGCVAIDNKGGSLGIPLNEKGGGVFVLEWDPVNRHMRTWVFAPHADVPENLARAIQTAHEPVVENRVMPLPDEWSLPYGYFPLGTSYGP